MHARASKQLLRYKSCNLPEAPHGGHGKVVQLGANILVPQVVHVAVASAVSLKQRLLVLACHHGVDHAFSDSCGRLVNVLIVTVAIVEVDLLLGQVLYSQQHKLPRELNIVLLDGYHEAVVAVLIELSDVCVRLIDQVLDYLPVSRCAC